MVQLDFNALYAGMQKLRMPTTPGVLWRKEGNKFVKGSMKQDVSYPHLQWINYLQATMPYLDRPDGTRALIEHGYYRGEYEVEGVGKSRILLL